MCNAPRSLVMKIKKAKQPLLRFVPPFVMTEDLLFTPHGGRHRQPRPRPPAAHST
jgi:hypothetical protein